jgi:molybdate transport system ATP-binding protein
MIDVDLKLSLRDKQRRFELRVSFSSDAPVLALFGPSGAGKSLTLQAMAGLLRPDGGHVRIGGRSLFNSQQSINLAPAERRIGYLFQSYALFPHLSVRTNIGFGLGSWRQPRLSREDQDWVTTLLQRFDLQGLAEARPADLSGGQQQRVALARALACRPELLLLDEPFAALNPLLRRGMREQLKQLREQWQIPIVMISHDVDDVLALADEALVIEQGQVMRQIDLASGAASEFFSPAKPGQMPHPQGRRIGQLLDPGRDG